MIELSSFSSAFVLFPILGLLYYSVFPREKRHQYPPGPRPKPIIGNAMDIWFSGRPWLHYLEWSKRLSSDIVHMSVFNIHIVVLHKMEDAIALLEKRADIYSDRPIHPITNLSGMDFVTPLLPCEDRWKRHRKIFQEGFRKDRVHSYHHIITEKVHLFLGELLKDPSHFSNHCTWLAASIIFEVTFGYKVAPDQKHDRLVEASEFAAEKVAELLTPGRTILSILPFLGRIPPWFPGAYTQRLLAKVKKVVVQNKRELFEHAIANMSQRSNDCVVATLLRARNEGNKGIYDDETLKDAMSTAYFGGVETVQNTTLVFILSMALHPEAQLKAQMEIDQFVGTERLPTYEDRASLPYIEAIYREVLRWRPVTPLGVVHTSTSDDMYKGFYIPKGTLVFPNVWAIGRDEARYRDSDHFMPERFFNVDGTLNNDTVNYAFGFGRRICSGRYMADSEVWLMVACVLATFDVTKAKDDEGNEINIDPNAFIDSLAARPLPFKCSILPRSRNAEKNIHIATRNAV